MNRGRVRHMCPGYRPHRTARLTEGSTWRCPHRYVSPDSGESQHQKTRPTRITGSVLARSYRWVTRPESYTVGNPNGSGDAASLPRESGTGKQHTDCANARARRVPCRLTRTGGTTLYWSIVPSQEATCAAPTPPH